MQARGGEPMSLERAKRILDGENPVRVWREYRGLPLRAPAARAGIGASYLSEIERSMKPGSVEAYKALADALDTSVHGLVIWPADFRDGVRLQAAGRRGSAAPTGRRCRS